MRGIMSIMVVRASAGLLFVGGAVFAGAVTWAADVPKVSPVKTTLTILNQTASTASMRTTNRFRVTGMIKEALPVMLDAGQSYTGVASTAGMVDAGDIYYGPCHFAWRTEKKIAVSGSVGWVRRGSHARRQDNAVSWVLVQTAQPESQCKVDAHTADYATGEHAVTFTILRN